MYVPNNLDSTGGSAMTNRSFESVVSGWTRNFVWDSGYYAGRGPSKTDLNSEILEAIYRGIRQDISEVAAINFVRFVNNLVDLSASSFIVAFERFHYSDYETIDVPQRKEDRARLTGRGHALQAQALAVFAGALFGRPRDEAMTLQDSNFIKEDFIRAHRDEIPTGEKKNDSPDMSVTYH